MTNSRRRRLAVLADQITRRPDSEWNEQLQRDIQMYFDLSDNLFSWGSGCNGWPDNPSPELKKRYAPRHPRETIRKYMARVMGMPVREWDAHAESAEQLGLFKHGVIWFRLIIIHKEMKNSLSTKNNELIDRILSNPRILVGFTDSEYATHAKAIDEMAEQWEKKRQAG